MDTYQILGIAVAFLSLIIAVARLRIEIKSRGGNPDRRLWRISFQKTLEGAGFSFKQTLVSSALGITFLGWCLEIKVVEKNDSN